MGLKGKPAADQGAAGAAEDVSFARRLNDAIVSRKGVLIAIGALIIVAVVGIGVASAVGEGAAKKATAALEKLEADYEAFSALEPDKRAAALEALAASADALSGGKSYAAQRALAIKAQAYGDAENPAEAEKAYADLAARFPDSHMAPVALLNAAAMAEDAGNADAALKHLESAEKLYPDAPGIGRATLSIGRLHESAKRYDKALEAYGRLVAGGEDSDWTKLARDRIIVLKSQGLAK